METENNAKQRLEVIIDLETTSKEVNAGILSWSMVPFFLDGSPCNEKEFDKYVDLATCYLNGMDMNGCQEWWTQQSSEAVNSIYHAPKAAIDNVAGDAYLYLKEMAERYDLYVWSRGLDFDIPKIEYCFTQLLGLELPYRYNHKMDVRTVLALGFVEKKDIPFEGKPHISIFDCRHDVKLIQKAYGRIIRGVEYMLSGENEQDAACLSQMETEIERMEAENESLRAELAVMSDEITE